MIKQIIFWGASGQAKVINEFIDSIGFQLVAIFDNKKGLASPFTNVPIYYGEDEFHKWKKKFYSGHTYCLITIGGNKGRDRYLIQQFLIKNGLIVTNAIHPSAYVSKNAKIGSGAQILINSSIGAETRLQEACIINTSASVDHECVLEKGVHVGPGACLAGCVSVGEFTMIGTGATVLPRITIGANVIIGAGAVITKDIPDNSIAIGIPARITKKTQK